MNVKLNDRVASLCADQSIPFPLISHLLEKEKIWFSMSHFHSI